MISPRPNGLTAPSRRGFLGGLIGLVAAPAIVRVASLMPVRPLVDLEAIYDEIMAGEGVGGNSLLTINEITREAVRLFVNSNQFIRNITIDQPLVSQLRLRPVDYKISY